MNKMPICANITISLCMTIRYLAMKSLYIELNHLSCKDAFSKTQSQRMWLFLRSVVRQRSSSPSCRWTLEITDFLTEVTAPWTQSFFQIQMKFHSTRESHVCDLLALSMLNIKRITANNGGVELEIILYGVKYKATQIQRYILTTKIENMLPLNMSSTVCVVVAFTWYQMLNEYGLHHQD